jgi:two-component system chemotaxis sensor kinase CheA
VSAPAFLDEVADGARREVYAACRDADLPCTAVEWSADGEPVLAAHDPLAALRAVPGVAWLDVGPAGELPALAALDPARSLLRFRALAAARAADVRTALAGLPGRLAVEEHDARSLAFPVGDAGGWRGCDAEAAALGRDLSAGRLLAAWDAVDAQLRAPGAAPYQRSALGWMHAVLETERPDVPLLRGLAERVRAWRPAPPEALEARADAAPAAREAALLLLRAQREMLAAPCDAELVEGRILAAGAVAERALEALGEPEGAGRVAAAVAEGVAARSPRALCELLGGPAPGAPVAAPQGAAPRGDLHPADAGRQELKVLKVDPERIDRLMDLVSELVVAKNSLPFLARRVEEGLAPRRLARELKERYAVLHRIAEDLQGSVMGMRMVPVSQVFRRFHRLVRDVGAKLGKQIRLEVEGDETEADKGVVEDLYEPLVHLLRNAMDHGLETPAEREAAGKPPVGTIRLRASRRDDQVVIEVSDDGRGIDPERIREKAVEKGVIGAAQAGELGREEALQLVFLPGFSTMEQASELSGRGVGMDVVRTMVARAGGTLALQSDVGSGTRLTLALPITMTVSQVMVFEVGGVLFGLPFASIVETVRVEERDVRRVGDHEVLVLRGRLVPVFRVARALDLAERAAREDVAVMVVRVRGEEIGLCVDVFHGGVDVILKPMDGVMKSCSLFAGTTLLGDGRVLLVLDLKELVQCLSAA